ncbi:MAG: GHKL domain-containing protein [Bacteroidales bacterium]|nr:GHKL domain-containing protein [Bacteroidales bacterium]
MKTLQFKKKREKELRDKNAELERFTYTVSHDLKSPLVTIKGFIGMLELDIAAQKEENIIDDMQRIKSATDKMTNLLNDLLELSRIGRIINPPVKIPMSAIVAEAVELLSGILNEKKVVVDIQDHLPDVFVDKQRITEVWQNLIENAVKFMGNQQNPKIYIRFIKEDVKFIFTIEDNGVGIDEKYHQTIFGLFNKLENKSEGTGIGLALVKRIVEVHGGDVWVESKGYGVWR